ncbi:hypothetical protein KIW84_064510 [Lathyrus oleraceus]|uniref:Reverse transcriptase zinc-binding domain-containing protein n=1 Tax=Pisum sativum TaxID=3888 RepID=A0A9D4WCT3_PEA|nr:hypothetical protein KIW84_064510 [Pisum sativum]
MMGVSRVTVQPQRLKMSARSLNRQRLIGDSPQKTGWPDRDCDSLWVQVLKHNYISKEIFLNMKNKHGYAIMKALFALKDSFEFRLEDENSFLWFTNWSWNIMDNNYWKWVYHIPSPEKVKFFLWTTLHKSFLRDQYCVFMHNLSHPTRTITWNAHKDNNMILNVDDSSLGNPDILDFGGLIRNTNGAWVHGFAGNVGYFNIVHVELMTLYHDLRKA